MSHSRRRATLVWAVAVAAYVVAVLHRTSFGVAGPDAAARFDVSAGVLAGFTTLPGAWRHPGTRLGPLELSGLRSLPDHC